MKMIDLTGQSFGRWVVVGRAPNTAQGQARWLCRCECGNERIVKSIVIRRGLSQSCGCLKLEILRERSTKHGHAHAGKLTPTYKSWASMLSRCNDPNAKTWPRYGGRGIKACKRWNIFENFLADMGERPPGTTLDRKDNEKGYTPSNCRWASNKEQARNKSTTVLLTFNGVTRSLMDWSELLGINYDTLKMRVKLGWTDEQCLSTPVIPGSKLHYLRNRL